MIKAKRSQGLGSEERQKIRDSETRCLRYLLSLHTLRKARKVERQEMIKDMLIKLYHISKHMKIINYKSYMWRNQYILKKIDKVTLSVKEVAQLIGVSSTSIYAMVSQGQIPHIKVRSRILFHRDVIEEWLRGNTNFKGE